MPRPALVGEALSGGYTSYASLNQLHKFSSTFGGLERKLTAHVRKFAAQLDMDLRGRTIAMTDFWVNIMPEHAAHSLHLHPLSFLSGTYYVATPAAAGTEVRGSPPEQVHGRPPKTAAARPATSRTSPTRQGRPCHPLRKLAPARVAANRVTAERISVSFNYNWS